MISFHPLETLIYKQQINIINFLHSFGLLGKLNSDSKRVITHFILNQINESLQDNTFFTYSELPENIELCEYFSYEKLSKFINKLLQKINPMINYKIIFIKPTTFYPHIIDDLEELSFWYGDFYDSFIIQTNKSDNRNTTKFKKFLEKNSLYELQDKFNYRKII